MRLCYILVNMCKIHFHLGVVNRNVNNDIYAVVFEIPNFVKKLE